MRPTPFGNYTLIRLLGKGGMAEVFLARCPSNMDFEKLLAIKRLLPPYNVDRQIISMLADEARLSVWLNHPNIVQILDFGLEGNTYYLAMEYVDGCDLCDLIRPGGKVPGRALPLSTVLYIFVQLAEALDYAHCRRSIQGDPLNIIHRDVSPHNVLISREGQVKLADFGLARATISVHQSRAGVVRGKFSYMPKEQAMGLEIDHRIDLFALGVSMYEALTGKKPYTSGNLAQQLYQLQQPIPPPSALVEEIPEEIDDITLQAMSPEVEGRYSSAEDLARDLRHALSQRSTFNQEADRLAALVSAQLGHAEALTKPMEVMSLADVKVSHRSLIHRELRAAQQHTAAPLPPDQATSPPRADRSDRAAEQPPGLPREGQGSAEDATTGPPAPRPDPQDMDDDEGLDTVEYRRRPVQEAAGHAPAAAPEVPEISVPLDPVAHLINPHDTVEDPEAAGALARAAIQAHLAGADKPEQPALAASRRREEHTSEVGREPRERGGKQRVWPLILAAALLALVVGGALGWLVRGAAEEGYEPVPSRGGSHVTDLGRERGRPISVALSDDEAPRDGAPGSHSEGGRDAPAPRATPLDATPPRDTSPAGQVSSAAAPRLRPPPPEPEPSEQRPVQRSQKHRTRRSPAAPRQDTALLTIHTDIAAQLFIGDRRTPLPLPVEDYPLKPGIHRLKIVSLEQPDLNATRWVVLKQGDTKRMTIHLLHD